LKKGDPPWWSRAAEKLGQRARKGGSGVLKTKKKESPPSYWCRRIPVDPARKPGDKGRRGVVAQGEKKTQKGKKKGKRLGKWQ